MLQAHNEQNLGEWLVQQGALTPDQLKIAQIEQYKHHSSLKEEIIRLGFVTERILSELTNAHFGYHVIELNKIIFSPEALALIPQAFATKYQLIPFSLEQQRLKIALVDPHDLIAVDSVSTFLKRQTNLELQLEFYQAPQTAILEAIEQQYGLTLSIEKILEQIEKLPEYATQQKGLQLTHLVDAIFHEAVQKRASDIHLEPEAHFIRIRYRIDGVLHQIRCLHLSYWPHLLGRIKVLAQLDLAETRAPQDGHFHLILIGRTVDFRVATHPTLYGENVVLRLLDREQGLRKLESLQLTQTQYQQIQQILQMPEGLVLITGPTGSGKTSTLYSMIQELNTEHVNIMTLEDPVEYAIPLVRQTAINENAKMNFATGVRALLRQDPDIILVGEIRDVETAQMAMQAAMTGHKVFSTLHTNSALDTLLRLMDMGISTRVMAKNLIGMISQRLVRQLCPHCKTKYKPSRHESTLLKLNTENIPQLYRAEGCQFCQHTGYQGRRLLLEILHLNLEIAELIADNAPQYVLHHALIRHGFVPLADHARQLVLAGETSLDEVQRVVNLLI